MFRSNSEIIYILQIHFTTKKLWFPDPQSLLQCKYLICHHVRLFGFDYYVSNIYYILFCYYFDSDVSIQIPKLFIFFKSNLEQKKIWYPDPQSLLQCKYLIFHHGGQLIATHCLLCYSLFFSYPCTLIPSIPSKPFVMDDDNTLIWRVYCRGITRPDT